MEKLVCGFCGIEESDKNPIILGDKCKICSICVLSAYSILFGDESIVQTDEEIDFLDKIRNRIKKGESKE